jgi:hypothetical protein
MKAPAPQVYAATQCTQVPARASNRNGLLIRETREDVDGEPRLDWMWDASADDWSGGAGAQT